MDMVAGRSKLWVSDRSVIDHPVSERGQGGGHDARLQDIGRVLDDDIGVDGRISHSSASFDHRHGKIRELWAENNRTASYLKGTGGRNGCSSGSHRG